MRGRWIAVLIATLAPLAAVAGCGEKGAPTQKTELTASAAPAASAPPLDGGADAADAAVSDAAADARVVVDAGPPPPLFSEEPLPDKRSPMPRAAEWEAAPRVSIDRGCAECDVRRVREWIRVTGPWDGGLVLIGGTADGMSLRKGEIVFPVRRGDRREIEMLVDDRSIWVRGMDDLHMPKLAGVLSEQWIAGDDRPRIVHQ